LRENPVRLRRNIIVLGKKPKASMRHHIAHYLVPAQFASNHTTLVKNTAKLRTAVTTNRRSTVSI
jgi:hypothetical protein